MSYGQQDYYMKVLLLYIVISDDWGTWTILLMLSTVSFSEQSRCPISDVINLVSSCSSFQSPTNEASFKDDRVECFSGRRPKYYSFRLLMVANNHFFVNISFATGSFVLWSINLLRNAYVQNAVWKDVTYLLTLQTFSGHVSQSYGATDHNFVKSAVFPRVLRDLTKDIAAPNRAVIS